MLHKCRHLNYLSGGQSPVKDLCNDAGAQSKYSFSKSEI